MTYQKYASRDLEDQNEYMWDLTTYESVLETIRNRSILPIFPRYLQPGASILEAGCGNGAWVKYLNDQGYHALGVDNNWLILQQAGEQSIDLLDNDVKHLCFSDNSLDACLSLGVIEHFLEGPGALLQEMWRVLKPGGYLFVSTPCNNWLRKLLNHPLRDTVNLLYKLQGKQLHFVEYRFDPDELVTHVRVENFEIVETVLNDYRLDQCEYSIGFYTDWPFLRNRSEKWKLNGAGQLAYRTLKSISPYLVVSGVLVVARKPA